MRVYEVYFEFDGAWSMAWGAGAGVCGIGVWGVGFGVGGAGYGFWSVEFGGEIWG